MMPSVNGAAASGNLLEPADCPKRKATSTPYDNKPMITISPGSTNSSFISTSQIHPFGSGLKVPINSFLAPSFNASKAREDTINVSSSTSKQDESLKGDKSSSQEKQLLVTKLVINEETLDNEIMIRESYLNQLKSIDLSKYSFPNENLPKTDYTYARTSSYLSENKHLANDSLGMPNLCRRSRKSPSNQERESKSVISGLTNLIRSSLVGSSSSSSPPIENKNTISTIVQSIETEELLKVQKSSKEKVGIYQSIKKAVLESAQLKRRTICTQTNNTPAKINQIKQPLVRNLRDDLEDDQLAQSKTTTRENMNEEFITTQRVMTTTRMQTRSQTSVSQRPEISSYSGRVARSSEEWSVGSLFTKKISWLVILLLLPAAVYYMDGQERVNVNQLMNRLYTMEPNQEAIHYLQDTFESSANCIRFFFGDYLPQILSFDNIKDKITNKTNEIKEQTSNYFGELANEYKHIKSESEDISEKILSSVNLNQTQIVESLNSVKDKIMDEVASFLDRSSASKPVDVEFIINEIDRKFNYTLTLMSKKLADQMRVSKAHESELSQVKGVLKEMNDRYKTLLSRMSNDNNTAVKEALDDEHVSFKTLEEYVKKTFQVYDADKTGMTDFASESLGGSILFTKCTETYDDNSRWLTVFNLPITRITTSPRVVIQNSLEPGNCWPFRGDKGCLFIKLAAKITPTSFSIEHIPKELSLTGRLDSAPRNFTIYGYERKEQVSDDYRLFMGNYSYDITARDKLQFFDTHQYYSKPISVIELKIESNWGHKDFTCLYKFRVHGRVFGQERDDVKP